MLNTSHEAEGSLASSYSIQTDPSRRAVLKAAGAVITRAVTPRIPGLKGIETALAAGVASPLLKPTEGKIPAQADALNDGACIHEGDCLCQLGREFVSREMLEEYMAKWPDASFNPQTLFTPRGGVDSLSLFRMQRFQASPLEGQVLQAVSTEDGKEEPEDFDLPKEDGTEGHFYMQTGNKSEKKGYAVMNDTQAQLWKIYNAYGGFSKWGYPLSNRYTDSKGRICQVFEKGEFQVTVDEKGFEKSVEWRNIFDELETHLTAQVKTLEEGDRMPPFTWNNDAELNGGVEIPWSEQDKKIKAHVQMVFDKEGTAAQNYPQLKEAYLANPAFLQQYGLPISEQDFGDVVMVRCQRSMLQLWKNKMPWTQGPNEVTVDNGGKYLKKYGMIPGDAGKAVEYKKEIKKKEPVETFVVGETEGGKPIEATRVGTGELIMMIDAGLHKGPETETVLLAQALKEHFIKNLDKLGKVSLVFIEDINRDSGYERRTNINHVDLNRNWASKNWKPIAEHSGGKVSGGRGKPFSEKETAMVAEFIRKIKPNLVATIHSRHPGSAVEGNDAPYDKRGEPIGKKVAKIHAQAAKAVYIPEWPYYSITGQKIDYLQEQGIPAYDVEMKANSFDQGDLDQHIPGFQAVIDHVNTEYEDFKKAA